jgi:uncharacterized membrane-anchored protein
MAPERMKNNTGRDSSLAGLRSVTLIVLAFGAITSIGLLRRAQQHPPPLIVVGFIVWVAAPFALLAIANILSARWARAVRVSLFVVTVLVTAASLAIYFDDSIAHRTAKPAFVYVAVPPVALIVSAIVLAIAAFMAKKRRTGHGSR